MALSDTDKQEQQSEVTVDQVHTVFPRFSVLQLILKKTTGRVHVIRALKHGVLPAVH